MNDQTMLPIDTDEVRHPMWAGPDPDEPMPEHLRRLLTEISVRLRPYDGRGGQHVSYDMPQVVNYLRNLYDDLATLMRIADPAMTTGNYVWCIGKVHYKRMMHTQLIDNLIADRPMNISPTAERERQSHLRQQRGTIERIAELLALAVARADDPDNRGG